MTEEPKIESQAPTSGGEEPEPPPPFEPDEDLITYLERGRSGDGEKKR